MGAKFLRLCLAHFGAQTLLRALEAVDCLLFLPTEVNTFRKVGLGGNVLLNRVQLLLSILDTSRSRL